VFKRLQGKSNLGGNQFFMIWIQTFQNHGWHPRGGNLQSGLDEGMFRNQLTYTLLLTGNTSPVRFFIRNKSPG
jgi:hypothetical protein